MSTARTIAKNTAVLLQQLCILYQYIDETDISLIRSLLNRS